jgi:hypothetical protein
MGEGRGEGELDDIPTCYIPLPLIPSFPSRRLYEPEAARGGEI